MSKIPDKSVGLIVCDLPYGSLLRKRNEENCLWDKHIDLHELWKQYRRVLKKGGNILFFASGQFVADVIVSNPRWYRYNLIWLKNKTTDFFHATQKPMSKHEEILVFGRSEKHIYNCGKTMIARDANKEHSGKCFSHIKRCIAVPKQGFPTTIMEYPVVGKQLVASQKPLELVQKLIRMYSDEGDLVLDPCMGGGTTALACIREGRDYVGFELNSKNYEICTNRIENEKD